VGNTAKYPRDFKGVSGVTTHSLPGARPAQSSPRVSGRQIPYLLGEPLNIFAFAYLARATAARYNHAMNTSLFDQVRQLSVEEQIELVEALWDNIVERNAVPGPTEAQKAELDRRLSEHAAHPDDVVPWSEVKDSALTRIRR
jgi:putative addiction module component (TIGR02574 family)